ncbi:MAG: hypothetical protein LBF39_01200 [Prevotellaceae bacterium]|nr:hypothetical protein [Prevotellaceae bacterium]
MSNLVMNAGTVTFDVSWKLPAPTAKWSDTVWVFVDYNDAGVMRRLPLLPGATLTTTPVSGIGKVIEERGNNNGVWVVGNARHAGHFSASVKLLTSVANAPGACAYASNYQPTGKYNSATNISFTGTPMYNIVLKHTDGSVITTKSDSPYLVPASYTLVSFTDATGMPGVFGCVPMNGDIDFSVPANISKKQKTSFVMTTQPVAPNASVTYHWLAPDFNPSLQMGSTNIYTTESPATAGTYLVTLTAQAAGYCNMTKTKEVSLNNCLNPVVQNLNVSASGFCTGAEGVVFALDDTQNGAQYQLYKDGAATGTMLKGRGGAATFTGKFDAAGTYIARIVGNGIYCEATMNGTHEITENSLPAAPNIAQPVNMCQHSGDIVFTAGNYSGTLVWTSNGGGTENGNNVTFSSAATGTKTVVARSEQTYPGAPTCYSSTVTRSATVHTPPVISAHPQSQEFCEPTVATTLTVTAAQGSGNTLSYQWKKGAGAGSDVGTDSNVHTDTVSALTDYWVVVTDNNNCTVTSGKATITVSGYTGGQIGTGVVCNGGPGRIGR